MIAGTLSIQMEADMSKLARDMSEAKRTTGETMNAIGASIGAGFADGWEKAKTAWEAFKEWMKTQVVIWGVALAVGVTAAVVGAVYAAFKAASFAVGLLTGESYKSANIDALVAMNKEVKTLQENLPLTAVGASALNEALKAQGVTADRYAAAIEGAAAALRTNREELDRLGVVYKDQKGNLLSTEQVLTSAAAVLATYNEGWDRNQAAIAIGMGSEKQIQAALTVSAEKIQIAKDRLVDYGLVIGEGTQEAVVQYEQSMRAFQREADLTSQGFKRAIADNVMPLLTQLADFFRDGFPTAVMAFRYSMATVTLLFYGLKTSVFIVAESILGFIESIGIGIGGLATASMLALKGDFGGAKSALVQGWTDAQARLGSIGKNIVEQARRNAKAMALAWGADSLGAIWKPDTAGPGGKPWTPKPAAAEEEAVAVAKVNAEYERLMKSIAEKTALTQAELAGQEKLTDAERTALNAMVGLRDGTLLATEAEKIRLRIALEGMLVSDKELKQKTQLAAATKAELETIDRLIKAREEYNASFAQLRSSHIQMQKDHGENIKLIALETKALMELGPQYGELTKRTLEYHVVRETSIQLARLEIEEMREIAKLNGEDMAFAEQAAKILKRFDEEREATRARIRSGLTSQSELNEARTLANSQFDIQVDMWRDVVRVAQDSFSSILDGGKNTFERLADTVKNTLHRVLFELTLKPVLIQIVASAAGTSVAQSVFGAAAVNGGGAGGLLNLASTGNSLYNALSGNTSSFLSGLFGSSISAGTASTLSAAAGLGGASALTFGATGLGLAAPTGLGLGAGLGLSTAGVNAAAIGTGAAGAGGAMAAISTALPYIGIAIAAASMLGLFGGKKTAAVGTGYNFYGDYDPSGAGMLNLTSQGLTNVGPEPPIFRDPAGNHPATAYRTSVGGTVNELLRLAREIGLATDQLRPVSFSTGVSGVGQAAEDSSIPVVAGQIAEALAEQLIPGLKSMALENETLLATFVRLQQQVKLTDQIIEILGLNTGTAFRGVGAEAIKLRDELITLMGGMQNAASLTESFYQNFFTDAERFAIDSRRVNTALHELGVTALPRTRAEFRLLVEVQDLNTRAGREMFAALMQLAPAFAAVTQVIDEALTNLNTLAGVRSAALTAIDEQIRASESAAQTARRAADSYRQLTASLADAIVQLRGGDLSPLLPGQKLAEARAQLGTVYGLATAGDAQALAKLPQVATDFLSASRDYNASSAAYTRDFADVMRMLEQAGKLSEHWNEYEVTLLDLQTNLLEAIKAELTSPTSDTAVISQQSALLSTIQVLLGQQTSVILTGNAVQDVIRNITALDTAYSAEALRAMIVGDATQATGIAQVVLLLQTLVMLTGQQLAADAAAEASRIVEAAAAAAAFAATAATVAITTAQTSAAAAIATAQGSAPGVIAGATPALTFETWLAGFNSITREDDRRFYAEGGTLSLSEMMALFTATGHAGGGIASGWSMVGEQGPELANFASPARIYTASETRAALSGGISDEKLDKLHSAMKEVGALLIEASKRSREDMQEQNGVIKDGLKENARDTGNRMADAVDARTLA